MPRKNTTIPRVCEQCGRSFAACIVEVRKGKARFCSRACGYTARRKIKIRFTCDQCGRDFKVYPSRIKQGHVQFCSRACHQAFQKAHATMKDFWANIQKVGECWLWVGTSWRRGYGRLQYNGKASCAHRVAYELAKGPIPDGLLVCHTCDTPACINPDHLFLGTNRDNVHDAIDKGRFAFGVGKFVGEDSPAAKLTNQEVLEIRALAASGLSNKDIRERFGVGRMCVAEIVKRKTWKHI